MAFSVENTTPLIPSLLSFPFHILLIATLLRYRKKIEFNTPYFKILISISVHDILFFLFLILWNILAQGFDVIQKFPTLSATLRLAGGRAFYKGAQVALVAIALNRWINIWFPFKAKKLWKNTHTVTAIVLQYAAVVGTVLVHSTPNGRSDRQSHTNEAGQVFYFTLFNIVATGAVSVLYTISFYKLRAANNNSAGESEVEQSNRRKQEKKLAAQGLMLSLLMVVHGLLSALKLTGIYDPPFFKIVLPTVTAANYYLGPLIALVMSKDLRKHAKMMLLGDNSVSQAPTSIRIKDKKSIQTRKSYHK